MKQNLNKGTRMYSRINYNINLIIRSTLQGNNHFSGTKLKEVMGLVREN